MVYLLTDRKVRGALKRRTAVILASILFCLAMPALADVMIDETHFPDQAFRVIVRQFDRNADGALSGDEIAAATAIDFTDPKTAAILTDWPQGVTSLEGIGYLTELEQLNCSSAERRWSAAPHTGTANNLTRLDLSGNTRLNELICYGNKLETLTLGNNPELTYLDCHANRLTTLDLSGCTALELVYCHQNSLRELNTGDNDRLNHLDCSGNRLTALDVSGNPGLATLFCNGNLLTALDLTACNSLQSLECQENRLAALITGTTNTALSRVNCSSNLLTELDVSGNTGLSYLYCRGNSLTGLDVSANTKLIWLFCSGNLIPELHLQKNVSLEKLDCSDNQLTVLELGNNKLTQLLCGNNRLTSLDVTKNTALQELQCQHNDLTALDLSRNQKLEVCNCHDNRLRELNLDNNAGLAMLEAYGNLIMKLDITNCAKYISYLEGDYRNGVRRDDGKTEDGYDRFPMTGELGLIVDPYTRIWRKGDYDYPPTTDVYSITVESDGHGTAYASAEIGTKGDMVFLVSEPEQGYRLQEWQVVSGEADITDYYFQIMNNDVTIRAVFVPME